MKTVAVIYMLLLLAGWPGVKDEGPAVSCLSRWPDAAPSISEARQLVQHTRRRGSQQERVFAWTALGRGFLNQLDCNRAIVCYTKAASLLTGVTDNQLKGVLFSDMAETYRETYDYPRALDFASMAVQAFREAGDTSSYYVSLAALAAVHQKLHHWEQADSLFSIACPQIIQDTATSWRYYSLYAEGKMICRETDVDPWGALDILYRKREELEGTWNSQDYAVAAMAYAMLHLDETCDSLLAAINRKPPEVRRESSYLQYRIARFRGNPEEALRLAEEVLEEKDRKTAESMSRSLSQTLRNYYAEEAASRQKEAQLIRAKAFCIIFILLLGAIFVVVAFERRHRVQLEEKNRLLRLSEEAARILEETNAQLVHQTQNLEDVQASLRKSYAQMFQKQYVAIGALCDSYFSPQSNAADRAERVLIKVENLLAYISEEDTLHARLEEQIDTELDGLLTQLKQDLGSMPKTDARVLCYHILGFRASTIAAILNTSPNAIYIRLSRIRDKISKSDFSRKERYLQII